MADKARVRIVGLGRAILWCDGFVFDGDDFSQVAWSQSADVVSEGFQGQPSIRQCAVLDGISVEKAGFRGGLS